MVPLEELQQYCIGKQIIIVGNSTGMLNSKYKNIIDKYDIVVRINRGYQHNQHLYDDYLGTKTNILSIGVKSAVMANRIIKNNTVDYIVSPIIYSERLNFPNVYDVEDNVYNSLKQSLGGVKPSTGISTYNFFNRFMNFERLDLIGFDFFESSLRQRNELGHLYVADHNGTAEMKFFESTRDPEKTLLHKTEGQRSFPQNNNIPKYFIKNKQR